MRETAVITRAQPGRAAAAEYTLNEQLQAGINEAALINVINAQPT